MPVKCSTSQRALVARARIPQRRQGHRWPSPRSAYARYAELRAFARSYQFGPPRPAPIQAFAHGIDRGAGPDRPTIDLVIRRHVRGGGRAISATDPMIRDDLACAPGAIRATHGRVMLKLNARNSHPHTHETPEAPPHSTADTAIALALRERSLRRHCIFKLVDKASRTSRRHPHATRCCSSLSRADAGPILATLPPQPPGQTFGVPV